MAIGPFITKGIGVGSTIPRLVLHGLTPTQPVDLTGNSTGYAYNTSTPSSTVYTYDR